MNEELEQTSYSELLDNLFDCFLDRTPVSYELYNKFRDFQLIAVSDHNRALKHIQNLLTDDNVSNKEVEDIIKEKLKQTWIEGENRNETF